MNTTSYVVHALVRHVEGFELVRCKRDSHGTCIHKCTRTQAKHKAWWPWLSRECKTKHHRMTRCCPEKDWSVLPRSQVAHDKYLFRPFIASPAIGLVTPMFSKSCGGRGDWQTEIKRHFMHSSSSVLLCNGSEQILSYHLTCDKIVLTQDFSDARIFWAWST